MDKNKILPSFVCGFAVAALSVIPQVDQGITCCLLVPLASVSSVVLYQKVNRTELPFKTGTALVTGLLTGLFSAVFATFFDTILTLITHTNEFVEALPLTIPQLEKMFKQFNMPGVVNESIQMLKSAANEIRISGFSAFYTFSMLFSNIFINSVFGMIGGLLALLFVNRREKQ